MGWGGRTAGLRRQRHHALGNAAGNATTRQATQQTTPPHDRQRNRQHRNAADNATDNAAKIKKEIQNGGARPKAAPPHFVARPEAAPFFIFAALSVALPVALPRVWWRCLLRCLPRGGVACRVVALPAASGRPPPHPNRYPPARPPPRATSKKSTFLNRKRSILAKNTKIERFRPRDHQNRNVLDARLSIELTRAP